MSNVPVQENVVLGGLTEVFLSNQRTDQSTAPSSSSTPPPLPPPTSVSSVDPFLTMRSVQSQEESNKRKTRHVENPHEYETFSGGQLNAEMNAQTTVTAASGSKGRTKRSGRTVAKSLAIKHTVTTASRTLPHQDIGQQPGTPATTESSSTDAPGVERSINSRTRKSGRKNDASLANKQTVPAASGKQPHQEHQQPGSSTGPAIAKESSTPAGSNKNPRMTIGEKTFRCKVQNCGKSYTSAKTLSTHSKNKHPIENAPPTHECMRCHVMFPTKTALNKHVAEDHRRDFKCSLCPKCTGRGNLLRKHIQENHPEVNIAETLVDIHMKSKGHESGSVSIFLCSKCDYYSTERYQFKEHIPKRHGGNGTAAIVAKCLEETAARDDARLKSYKCTICRWRTTQANAITDHVETVHPTKNANDVSEAILRTLNQIDIVHMDIVPTFECYLCKYSGESGHALYHHIKQRHEEYNLKQVLAFSYGKGDEMEAPKNVPWFQCNFCPKSKRRLANIKRHVDRVHKDKRNDQSPSWERLSDRNAETKEKAHMSKKNDESDPESDEGDVEMEGEMEGDEEPVRKIRKVGNIGQSKEASKKK